MLALTEEELQKIFSWRPYRPDWPIDRDAIPDYISERYGELISSLTRHPSFDCYYSEDGSMGNYLGFYCYPQGYNEYEGGALSVCISLCAPIAAYGETTLYKSPQLTGVGGQLTGVGGPSTGVGGLFSAERVGMVRDERLKEIEAHVVGILEKNGLSLIDPAFAGRPLPAYLVDDPHYENLNNGRQVLHGIFQLID